MTQLYSDNIIVSCPVSLPTSAYVSFLGVGPQMDCKVNSGAESTLWFQNGPKLLPWLLDCGCWFVSLQIQSLLRVSYAHWIRDRPVKSGSKLALLVVFEVFHDRVRISDIWPPQRSAFWWRRHGHYAGIWRRRNWQVWTKRAYAAIYRNIESTLQQCCQCVSQ